MGFIKYLGKEFKHAIGEWWYNDGLEVLAAYALAFGMALVISAIVFAPEHIQKISIIILLIIMGLICLVAAGLAIWQVIDWFNDKYKEYKRER